MFSFETEVFISIKTNSTPEVGHIPYCIGGEGEEKRAVRATQTNIAAQSMLCCEIHLHLNTVYSLATVHQ